MRYTFPCIGFICLFALACKKEDTVSVIAEAPATKTVIFTVYAGADFTHPLYDSAKGQVELSIAKISDNGTVTKVLWDTVFTWRQLAAYPTFQNKINIRKEFSVLDSKEKLQVSSIRKYNLNGSLSQAAKGEPVSEGNASMQYDVEM